MKVVKVKFQNFRNVPDIEKELNGANIILLAENRKGKSNFIKGIQGALGINPGINAIANGKDQAEVELLLADFNGDQLIPGTNHSFKMKIKRDKENQEKVSLEVIAPNGFKETKKTVIGSLAGEIELDYDFVALSKTKAGKQRQLEIIKSYLDEETRKALDLEQNKAKRAYDERTEVGRLKAAAEGFIKEAGILKEDFDTYKEKKDLDSLKKKRDEKRAERDKRNNSISELNSKLAAMDARYPEIDGEIEELEIRIGALKKEKADIERKKQEGAEWLKTHSEIDITEVEKEYDDAVDFNSKVDRVSLYKKKQEECKMHAEQYGELTALIDSSKQAIEDTMRQMDFPIEGISFDDENVFYKGKIVDESTMSTSEIMMLEVELKMSKLPGAEVVFIQRGESLGREMLSQLQAVAKERGFQIIMEQVERGTEELRIEFMPS